MEGNKLAVVAIILRVFDMHSSSLHRFAEDGVNFSLNTDDTLVCRTDMTHEFDVAFNRMGFSAALLTKAVSTYLFLTPSVKNRSRNSTEINTTSF